MRQGDPPPYRPPPGRTTGGYGARPPPPARPPAHERQGPAARRAAPTGRAGRGDRAGPPHPHARAHNTWIADPESPSSGRAVAGEGERMTPGAPRNGRRHPPRGRFAATPSTPSQVGGNRDRTAPPQARQTEQGTGAGHAEGHGPRGTALPAPSAVTTRGAHATPPRGGGERTPRERESTQTKGTRGDYQKGNRTERAERTDRVEWRTSKRG